MVDARQVEYDRKAQPVPDYEFDQRIASSEARQVKAR
jgi:hypothetical protein